MKKYLLIGLAVGVGSTVFAQGAYNGPSLVTLQKINPIAAKQTRAITAPISGYDSFESIVNNLGSRANFTPATKSFTSANIGMTEYQNQTNASVCNRLVHK